MPYKDPNLQRQFQRSWATQRRAAFLRSVGCQKCGGNEEPLSCVRIKREPGAPKPFFSSRNPDLTNHMVLCHNCSEERHEILYTFSTGGPLQRRIIQNWRNLSMKYEFIEPHLRRSLTALERKGFIRAGEEGFELTERGEDASFYLHGNRRLLNV